jgi:hypothetical protein
MATHRKLLLRHGIAYPTTPAASNHATLALAVMHRDSPRRWEDEVKLRGLPAPPRLADYWAQFEAEMNALPPQAAQVVLSAERFGAMLSTRDRISALHARLAPHFSGIRVVAYLRRQDAHAASAYSQMLRSGIIGEPSLVQPKSRYGSFYDYAELLDNWSAVFDAACIVPRIFERASLRQGDVLQDFLHICGVADMKLPRQDNAVQNPSLSMQGQALLLSIGRLLQAQTGRESLGGDKVWEEVASLVSETCVGRGWRPCRDEAREFLALYSASNEAVRRRWFPERPELFDLNDSDLPEAPVRLDMEFDISLFGAVLLQAARRSLEADSAARLSKARLAAAQNQPEKARALLQKAVVLDAGNIEARLALARDMADAGESALATAHAEAVLAARPGNVAAKRILRELSSKI